MNPSTRTQAPSYMNWKALSVVSLLLAVVMAFGIGADRPLIGLIALVLLLAVGVYTLYRLSLDEGGKGKKSKSGKGKKR
jgi:hypothetical protein